MATGDQPIIDDPIIEKEAEQEEGQEAEPQSQDAAAPEEPEVVVPTSAERIAARYEVEPTTVETAEQAQKVLHYYKECHDHGSHLFASYDKLGNLPGPLSENLQSGDKEGFIKAIDAMLTDPESVYERTDKIKQLVTDEHLPSDLRTGMANIVMKEGNRPPLELFALVRAEVAGNSELGLTDAVIKVKKETATAKEYKEDGIPRREAALLLLKKSFPQLEQQSGLVDDYMEVNRAFRDYEDTEDLGRLDDVMSLLQKNDIDVVGIEEAIQNFKAWDKGEKPDDPMKAFEAKMAAQGGVTNSVEAAISELPGKLANQ